MGTSLPSLREYPGLFGLKMVDLYEPLLSAKTGIPTLPDRVPSAAESFAEMSFGEGADALWAEAGLQEVCHYLRGGKSLDIPNHFRAILPDRL